jgi:hypothetical protein
MLSIVCWVVVLIAYEYMQARAASDCEIWYLSRSAFQKLLQKHPSVASCIPKMQLIMTENTVGNKGVYFEKQNRLVKMTTAKGEAFGLERDLLALQKLNKKRQLTSSMLSPESRIISCWTAVISVAVLYNMFVLVARIAYAQVR